MEQSPAKTARLSEASLHLAAAAVGRPRYERSAVTTGVVHFGPGAFHRAHQADYFDRILARDARFGICAVSLRTASVRDALVPQGGLYTLLELDDSVSVRVIGAVREFVVATESPRTLSARLAAPTTRLVTVTVTEKGYCLDGAGNLDLGHPDIRHDLAAVGEPRSVLGWIVRGFQLRRAMGLDPYTVISCDNLPDNGGKLGGAVREFASRMDPALSAWIADRGHFPRTMVDSITPATDDALRDRVTALTGLADAWPVQRERFTQWVIEETAAPGLPDWQSFGVTVSRNVQAFEQAKLRMLNGAHSALAYMGLLLGLETVCDAVSHPRLRAFVEQLLAEEVEPSLQGLDSGQRAAYRHAILRRFANSALRHRLEQIAWDGTQKLPIRIFGSLMDALEAGRSAARLTAILAAWMQFVRVRATAGVAIVDPLEAELGECGLRTNGDGDHDLPLFLSLPDLFPRRFAADPGFRRLLVRVYDRMSSGGVSCALEPPFEPMD